MTFNKKSFTTLQDMDGKQSQHGPENYWKLNLWKGFDNLLDPGIIELGKSSPLTQGYLPKVRINVLSGHLGT